MTVAATQAAAWNRATTPTNSNRENLNAGG